MKYLAIAFECFTQIRTCQLNWRPLGSARHILAKMLKGDWGHVISQVSCKQRCSGVRIQKSMPTTGLFDLLQINCKSHISVNCTARVKIDDCYGTWDG